MSINLDTNKVQSNVLPNLTKAKDNMQNTYDLSTNLKSIMPSSTMFKKYANELPNKIYNIKNNINEASKKIGEKVNTAKSIEVKNKSVSKALLLDEKLFNSPKQKSKTDTSDSSVSVQEQIILNFDKQIEQLENEKAEIDKKMKEIGLNISAQKQGIARSHGLYSGHPDMPK